MANAVASGHMERGVTLRLYSVYGPWEEPRRIMPTIAAHAAARRLPPALVDPAVARDFVHVDDVWRAADAWLGGASTALEPPVINIGSGVQTRLGELIAFTGEHPDRYRTN